MPQGWDSYEANYKMGFGKDGKGVIIREARSQALATLGPLTGIVIDTKIPITEDFRILKQEVIATITGLTAGEGAGLGLYLVDGQYSLAQFEASIEGTGPEGPNDSVDAELSMRFTKFIGQTFAVAGADGVAVLRGDAGNSHCKVNPRWTFRSAQSWEFILYNAGVALTTGSTVYIKAKSFGVWVV